MNKTDDDKVYDNAGTIDKSSKNCVILEIKDVKEFTLPKIGEGEPARVALLKNYLSEDEATKLYEALKNDLEWQQKASYNQNGEEYFEPRLTYWFGRPYKYSSVTWQANEEWHFLLEKLRERLCEDKDLGIDKNRKLNSVMCNYYRDNKDSIGWHADDETSLGQNPTIASISLGCTRIFEVCKRQEYFTRYGKVTTDASTFPGCTEMYRFHLGNGSLLLMKGSVQDDWLHRVPKDFRKMDGRINLTFRYIVDDGEEKEFIQLKKEQSRKRRNFSNKFVSIEGDKKMCNTKHVKDTPDDVQRTHSGSDSGKINEDVEISSLTNDGEQDSERRRKKKKKKKSNKTKDSDKEKKKSKKTKDSDKEKKKSKKTNDSDKEKKKSKKTNDSDKEKKKSKKTNDSDKEKKKSKKTNDSDKEKKKSEKTKNSEKEKNASSKESMIE